MSYNNGDKPLKTVAKIESIEDKEKSVKLKAGGKSFSFFKKKQDGTDTSTYSQFKSMEIKSGDVVSISYVISNFTTKDGKQASANKVIWFMEATGLPLENNNSTPNTDYKGKSEEYWNKLGYAKTLSNWTTELLGQGSPIDEIKAFIQNEAWELWKAIEVESDRRFNPARVAFDQKQKERKEIEETIPLPEDTGDDIQVEDIPF